MRPFVNSKLLFVGRMRPFVLMNSCNSKKVWGDAFLKGIWEVSDKSCCRKNMFVMFLKKCALRKRFFFGVDSESGNEILARRGG